jgi:membrane protease subunit (stomatin/prohibitin family)
MAVIDLVKWDHSNRATDQVYAWRYPFEELSTWTQLIVSESQEAVLLKEGQMIGPFTAGRHTLDTKNIPLIGELFKIPFGSRTPFTAEVWFVNRAMPLDVKWGTTTPIQLRDPEYKVMLPVRAFGQYGVQIDDTRKFLTKLVGTMPSFDRNQLISYFRGILLQRIKSSVAKKIVSEKISMLEIAAHMNEIANSLEQDLSPELDAFGVKLINFSINSINTPEDDPAVIRLKESLAERADMDIKGYSYQQMRSFDTMETAAGNEGAANSGIMGAGMGLGMGFGLGGAMGGAMGQMAQNLGAMNMGFVTQQPLTNCPKCQSPVTPGVRFCGACGNDMQSRGEASVGGKIEAASPCDKCGEPLSKGAKFCPKCGDAVFACPSCGADNSEDAKKCCRCGAAMPVTCPSCQASVSGNMKFCPECGGKINFVANCAKCGNELPPQAKFCGDCGTPCVE